MSQEYQFTCPDHCDWEKHGYDYPFFAHPASCFPGSYSSMYGIVVDGAGKATNIHMDGIRGVTKAEADWWNYGDDLPHCIVCLKEVIWDN